MSGDEHEPVTSPDQHRPTIGGRAARLGAVATIVILLIMTLSNNTGRVQDAYLVGIAAFLAIMLAVDFVLRRNGLRS